MQKRWQEIILLMQKYLIRLQNIFHQINMYPIKKIISIKKLQPMKMGIF